MRRGWKSNLTAPFQTSNLKVLFITFKLENRSMGSQACTKQKIKHHSLNMKSKIELKRVLNLVSILAFCSLLPSCYSYRIVNEEYREVSQKNDSKEKVYVLNADTLKNELKILEYSNLFEIVPDSLNADSYIRLYPPRPRFACGMPLIVPIMTLGQLPGYLPEDRDFEFDLISKEGKLKYEFQLGVMKRVWFWDLFSTKKNRNKTLGKVLYAEWKNKR